MSESRSSKILDPEGALLVRHREGDENAFSELVQVLRQPVYSYLVRLGIAAPDCDDLFQEIFVSIHRKAHYFDCELKLRPWVFTIALNVARDFFRKNKRSKVIEELQEESASEPPSAVDRQAARETVHWLSDSLQDLPLPQREIFLLCAVQDLDQKQVALHLKLPVNTVKTHLRRARSALARAFMRRKSSIEREFE